MRRPLSRVRLYLLCAVLAHGFGMLCAVQRASPRPPDAVGSTGDGFRTPTSSQLSTLLCGVLDQTVDEKQPAVTATSPHLKTERIHDIVNEPRPLLQSGTPGRENEAGFECVLTGEARERFTSSDDHAWIISDVVLEEIDNDLQTIVNCTREGDVIAFNVTGIIQPRSPVVIPWQLTLSTFFDGVDSHGDVSQSPVAKTRFTCPQENSGLFLVQAKSVTFVDLVIEGCIFGGTEGVPSLVEVAGCDTLGSSGLVALRRVMIHKNRLIGASGLHMSASSCSELEMVNVEIADNLCSSDGCGVLLAKRTSVENCTASGNRVVEFNKRPSSLLYAPASSNTTIQGFVASENNLTVFRVWHGVLFLSNASFNRNSLAKDRYHEQDISCIHLVGSSAAISKSSFTENEGYEGPAVFAKESNVFLSGLVFQNNVGSLRGGCVYTENSNVMLENSSVTNNSAGSDGGVVKAFDSYVMLENTAAINNSAGSYGGVVYAFGSDVMLENTAAINNSAGNDGGVVYAVGSNVMLENTSATNNTAKSDGGVVYAKYNSNVMVENTSATNNTAKYAGGVVFAADSNVKLENATATSNSAGSYGGVVYAFGLDVMLENTAAINNSAGNGGVVYAVGSNVMLENTSATNNTAKSDGGVVYAEYNSNVMLENTAATNNTAKYAGGVVYASKSDVKLENSAATNNCAKYLGGVVFAADSNVKLENATATSNSAGFYGGVVSAFGSDVMLENTSATNNSAGDDGGVVYAVGSNVMLENTSATNNTAKSDGGVVYAEYNSNVMLENTAAINNSAGNDGGVVYASKSDVKLKNTAATNNSAKSDGGVVYASKSDVKLKNTAVSNNTAKSDGGVVYASNSEVTLENTVATTNGAGDDGGVVYAVSSNVTLENTAAINSSAGFNGGVTYAEKSNVKLANTAVSNNTAKSDGGVVYASKSDVKLKNTAATNNSARSDGGVVYASNSEVTLENTVATTSGAGDHGGVVYAVSSNVTLENTAAINSSAGFNGGVTYAEKSNVKLANTAVSNSTAKSDGGVVYASKSDVKLKNTTATNNTAKSDGGVVCASNSEVTLENTVATTNSAGFNGGFVYLWMSNTKSVNTTATVNNAADGGGFMFTSDSIVTLVATNANSNRAETGGFLSAKDSAVTLDHINAISNSAQYGGFMSVEHSNASLKHSNASGNSAKNDGGFIYARQSMITLEYLKATNGSSERGALLYGQNSTLRVAHSHWSSITSKTAGGFAVATNGSSIFISDSIIVQGKSKDGGAIWLEKSHSIAHNLTIAHCEADGHGGGVMGKDASTFLCTDCVLHDNSANRGNGGAVFFDVERKQALALQLTSSRVENNTAILGGGVFFGCEEQNEECLTKAIDCPFMALTSTRFSGNTASVGGGAVFAGYLEAIRIRCSNATAEAGFPFYERREWRTLRSVGSVDDVCPTWKNNSANLYGPDIGTYAASARMTTEDVINSVCESGGEHCVIAGYRAGKELPPARVELLDRLNQGPATSYRPVTATMSSESGTFLTGSIVLAMEEGCCVFQHIKALVPPGEYKLTIEFDKREIKRIGVRVRVRDCLVGESLSDTGICMDCSSTTYSFPPSKNGCRSCPENGNCESQVITPNDGYWQKTPCSDRLYRCLPTAACRFDNRSDKLAEAVSDVRSCKFDKTWIEAYTGAQCAEGHEGPLCGSCSEEYGSGLSSECKKCLNGFFNATYIVMSALFLLGMTAITIRGTLSASRGETRQIPGQSASSSLLLEEPDSPHPEPEGEADDGVSASEKVLAKWKVVEMFKITLSYTQVTVLLASLDVGWALSLIVMAEAAEFFGGLASDGIRRSVVCLSSEDLSLQPTALALVVNTCAIPCAVLSFWIVFWATRSAKGGNGTPPRLLEKRCVLSLMVIWYITLVPVLKTALSVFLCVDVHDSVDLDEVDVTHKYWAVDTALECYRGDHSILIYAFVAFVCPVYGGLFLLFVAFLGVSVHHLGHRQGWAFQTSGFLYRSYRMDRRRYWEVAIVVRKAGIAFLVFCSHLFDSTLPITGVAHLIELAISMQILANPYRKRFEDLNRLEIGSLFVSLATTLSAIMLNDQTYPENYARELLTVACVLLNLITFFFFVFHILKFAADFFKSDLEEKGQTCAPDANMFRVLAQWICYEVKHHLAKLRNTPAESESSAHSAVEG